MKKCKIYRNQSQQMSYLSRFVPHLQYLHLDAYFGVILVFGLRHYLKESCSLVIPSASQLAEENHKNRVIVASF